MCNLHSPGTTLQEEPSGENNSGGVVLGNDDPVTLLELKAYARWGRVSIGHGQGGGASSGWLRLENLRRKPSRVLRLSVPRCATEARYDTEDGIEEFTGYALEVRYGGAFWSETKRLEDFVRLRDRLQSEADLSWGTTFPRTNFLWRPNSIQLEERRAVLHSWITMVTGNAAPLPHKARAVLNDFCGVKDNLWSFLAKKTGEELGPDDDPEEALEKCLRIEEEEARALRLQREHVEMLKEKRRAKLVASTVSSGSSSASGEEEFGALSTLSTTGMKALLARAKASDDDHVMPAVDEGAAYVFAEESSAGRADTNSRGQCKICGKGVLGNQPRCKDERGTYLHVSCFKADMESPKHDGALKKTPSKRDLLRQSRDAAREAAKESEDLEQRYENLLFKAVTSGDIETIRRNFVEHGAQSLPSKVNSDGHSLVHLAVKHGHSNVLCALLAAGADPNAGRSPPLFECAGDGCDECALALVAAGADMDARNAWAWTPMMTAADNGNSGVVRVLLAAGADWKAKPTVSLMGKTVLSLARAKKHEEIVQMVSEAEKSASEALAMSKRGSAADIAGQSLRKNVDALFTACRAGDAAKVQLSVKVKKVNPLVRDQNGMTPLHYAAEHGHALTVRVLVNLGAQIDALSGFDNLPPQLRATPLIIATKLERIKVMEELIIAGAALQMWDRWGWPPLHYAARNGSTSAVASLLAGGADVLATSFDGLSAHDLAKIHGHDNVCSMLAKSTPAVRPRQRSYIGHLLLPAEVTPPTTLPFIPWSDLSVPDAPVALGGVGKVFKGVYGGTEISIKPSSSQRSGSLSGAGNSAAELNSEADVLRRLNHPNVATYFGQTADPAGKKYMVTEWFEMGDLADLLFKDTSRRKHDGRDVILFQKYSRQLMSAVGHLHSMRVAHLNLKPENVRIASSGRLKLCECGLAIGANAKTAEEPRAIPYTPPEALGRLPVEYDYRCWDTYSLGILLWAMWNRSVPWSHLGENPTDQDIREALGEARRPPLTGGGGLCGSSIDLPVQVQKLIENLWAQETRSRWDAGAAEVYFIEVVSPVLRVVAEDAIMTMSAADPEDEDPTLPPPVPIEFSRNQSAPLPVPSHDQGDMLAVTAQKPTSISGQAGSAVDQEDSPAATGQEPAPNLA